MKKFEDLTVKEIKEICYHHHCYPECPLMHDADSQKCIFDMWCPADFSEGLMQRVIQE